MRRLARSVENATIKPPVVTACVPAPLAGVPDEELSWAAPLLLPVLVPVLLDATDPPAGKRPAKAFSTAICWAGPVWLSNLPELQEKPHRRPLLPPVHWAAAALALDFRTGRIVSEVKGALAIAELRPLFRKDLKKKMSVVHVLFFSQAVSNATPLGKNTSRVRETSP